MTSRSPVRIGPLGLRSANQVIDAWHRHHGQTQGHRFSLAAVRDARLIGVAVVGRPVARNINQETIVEVVRLATDGSQDACSALYGAAARAARELGFFAIITYTLASEPGASLRAASWWPDYVGGGGLWSRAGRERENTKGQGLGPKVRWVRILREWDPVLDEP